MTDLRIPFGLDRDTKEIVEPEDAARGRACNCICPSCHAPLLSRHPKENRIHFAHDSKHPEAKPEEECSFSSAVAVAMMARKLVESLPGKVFAIPNYYYEYRFNCCGKTEAFLVTKQKRLPISSSRNKTSCAGQTFDLELGFGGATILVDLFYEGKPRQRVEKKDIFDGEKSGVLAINCDTFDLGALAENKKTRFSDAVLAFLLETGKREWSFHPRQLSMSAKLEESHLCNSKTSDCLLKPDAKAKKRRHRSEGLSRKPASKMGKKRIFRDDQFSRQNIHSREIAKDFDESSELYSDDECLAPAPESDLKPLPVFEPKLYQCAMCQEIWLQKEAGAPTCPKCNTHLFAVSV